MSARAGRSGAASRGGDARDFQYPTEHWGEPGRAGLSSYHRRPPAPGTAARPSAAARLSVTSRDRSRGGALRPVRMRAPASARPRKSAAAESDRGVPPPAPPGGKRVWLWLRGLGRSWKGGGREGRSSGGTESSGGRRSGERGGTGQTCLQGSSGRAGRLPGAEGFPIGCVI